MQVIVNEVALIIIYGRGNGFGDGIHHNLGLTE